MAALGVPQPGQDGARTGEEPRSLQAMEGMPGPARYHITIGELVMPQCGAQATPAVPSTVPGLSQFLATGEGAASITSVL